MSNRSVCLVYVYVVSVILFYIRMLTSWRVASDLGKTLARIFKSSGEFYWVKAKKSASQKPYSAVWIKIDHKGFFFTLLSSINFMYYDNIGRKMLGVLL